MVVEIQKDLVGSVTANPRSTTLMRGFESESPSWEKNPEDMAVESLTMEQHKWSPHRRGIGQREVTGKGRRVMAIILFLLSSSADDVRTLRGAIGAENLLPVLGLPWLPPCAI